MSKVQWYCKKNANVMSEGIRITVSTSRLYLSTELKNEMEKTGAKRVNVGFLENKFIIKPCLTTEMNSIKLTSDRTYLVITVTPNIKKWFKENNLEMRTYDGVYNKKEKWYEFTINS